jgi:serine phosphatase RsbU (regulator of sigma subunit)
VLDAPAVTPVTPRRHKVAIALAVVLPIAVGVASGHPAQQVVVPESVMLAIAVILSLVDGVTAGLVAAGSATASLWFFNFPPGLSFRAVSGGDVLAVIIAGAITCALVLLTANITSRQRRGVQQREHLSAQVDRQRQTIMTMQRAILPETVPPTSGVNVAWRYVTGGQASEPVGGDWFAVVPISPTSLGVAIGDVAGHGLEAVRSMAEYRYGLRTLAAQGQSASVTLECLDDVALLFKAPSFSSCVYGILNLLDGTWTYSSAGHLPPLLIRDGKAHTLPAPHGPPIGTGLRDVSYTDEKVQLQPEDLLVLYTDGLIERRNEPIGIGLSRLGDRLSRVTERDDLFQMCTAAIQDLAGPTPADDVALVLVHYLSDDS